jgi:hypothetical protein
MGDVILSEAKDLCIFKMHRFFGAEAPQNHTA